MVKVAVPRYLLPKTHVLCPVCNSATKVRMSVTHAEGQHRRHICVECDFAVYSLTPFDGSPAITQGTPFKDRALTEFEAHKRIQMLDAAERIFVTPEVTFETEVVAALMRLPSSRTPRQAAIALAVEKIETIVNRQYPKENT